ncbi:MAG: tetratricopeptide repeat protein [Isosphaeraceae bacterium]
MSRVLSAIEQGDPHAADLLLPLVLLSTPRPKGQEGGLSRDATVREALDRAAPEIATAFAGEPLVEASIRNTLGTSYMYLGDREKALAQHQRALALRLKELGPEHPDTAEPMNELAIILLQMGKSAEAQKILEESVAIKRRTLGPEDKRTLHAMTRDGQSADCARSGTLPIGGLPLAGHLGPDAAPEGRRLILQCDNCPGHSIKKNRDICKTKVVRAHFYRVEAPI